MSRLVLLIVVLLLLLGGLFFLSTRASERPTGMIEVEVPAPGAQGGNAG